MAWSDGLFASIQGLGGGRVNGSTPTFTGSGNATLYGPSDASIVSTTQGTQLPAFGMPGAGGAVGANAYDTNGFGSNFSNNDWANLAAVGSNLVQGKKGTLDASKLAASDSDAAGLAQAAQMVGTAISPKDNSQQAASLEQLNNQFAASMRERAAKNAANPLPVNWAQPRKVMPIQTGILSGKVGSL